MGWEDIIGKISIVVGITSIAGKKQNRKLDIFNG